MARRSLGYLTCLGLFLGLLPGIACSSPDPTPTPGTGGSDNPGTGGQAASGGAAQGSGGGDVVGSGGGEATGGQGSGGDGSATGGTASGGGGNELSLVEPIMRSASSYVLEFGSYLFEIDPSQGARIVEFSLGGTNLLSPLETVGDGANAFLNGGSTFWVAPQDDDWGWPPPPAMDSGAYTPSLDGTNIVTTGAASTIPIEGSGNAISVNKTFSADLANEAIDIVYEVKNGGPGAAQHSPWEITRLDRDGITYWPKGDDACGGDGITPTETDSVYFWHDATQGSALTNNKISCDGAGGWMAHVAGDLLFVKKWSDVPAANQHDIDKEIQLYLGDGYIEMEMRGPYASIAVNASATWNVTWFVRPAPEAQDEASLIAAAEALVQ